MGWFVYVLLNGRGESYTGVARDVAARLARHNAGNGAKYTRGRGPWRVIHVDGPLAQGEALRRELSIKRDAAFKAGLKAAEAVPADFHSGPDRLPAVAGAYVLLVELARAETLALSGRTMTLPPGRYLYCGSARGPGGIKARVSRHMRPDKPVRWHIDRLTTTGRVVGAWVFPGGDECQLAARLTGLPVPLPGFGSSDCDRCPSHLLAWDGQPLPPAWVAAGT